MFMDCYYDYVTAYAVKESNREKRAMRSDRMMSANEWRFNDSGSAEPCSVSIETIFAAYHDYRNSQQWN